MSRHKEHDCRYVTRLQMGTAYADRAPRLGGQGLRIVEKYKNARGRGVSRVQLRTRLGLATERKVGHAIGSNQNFLKESNKQIYSRTCWTMGVTSPSWPRGELTLSSRSRGSPPTCTLGANPENMQSRSLRRFISQEASLVHRISSR
jgi:hypothetical protein